VAGHPRTQPARPDARLLLDTTITGAQLAAVRKQVEALARQCRLAMERVSDWVTAVHELMTNVVRHGGGAGQLRIWEDGHLVCEIRDTGPGFAAADYIGSRGRPPLSASGGMGLWIAQQMTDDLQIDSGPTGTVVRVAVALPDT